MHKRLDKRLVRRGAIAAAACLALPLLGTHSSAAGAATPEPNATTQTQRTTVAAKARTLTAIQFVDQSGLLPKGRPAVFTLTNTKTKRSVQKVVRSPGKKGGSVLVRMAPGRYLVAPPAPFIVADTTTVTMTVAKRGLVTVKKPTKKQPKQVAKAIYTTKTTAPALQVQSGDISPSSALLSWSGQAGSTYVVRRTDGRAPASTPTAGVSVPLATPRDTAISVDGLTPTTTYTFTVFGTSPKKVRSQASVTVETGSWDGSTPSFAIAPNTVAPQSFAALAAKPVAGGKVQVRLAPGNSPRVSASPVPKSESGLGSRAFARQVSAASNCVVGAPFLVTSEVAGANGFYGRISSCNGATAVVDTKVGLTAVLTDLDVGTSGVACLSLDTGTVGETKDANSCVSEDGDTDGLSDATETQLGTDPTVADTDTDGLTDGEEVNTYATDPLNPDSDFDRLNDEEVEQSWFGTNPKSPDTDNDGCWDYGELLDRVQGGTRNALAPDARTLPCPPLGIDGWQQEVADSRAAWEADFGGADRGRPAASRNALRDVAGDGTPAAARKAAARYRDASAQVTVNYADGSAAAGESPLECEGSRGATFSPGGYVKLVGDADVDIDYSVWNTWARGDWDLRGGIEFGINPEVSVEGEYSCSLNVKSIDFQLAVYPVPVVFSLTPIVKGTAEGSISLSGPSVSASFGLKSKGYARAEYFSGGLFSSSRVEKEIHHETGPYGEINVKPAELSMKGEVALELGANGTLAFGWKNRFVDATAGLSVDLVPMRASIEAEATATPEEQSFCAEFAVGATVAVGVVANAMIDIGVWEGGVKWEKELWKGGFTYPNASWPIGECD